MPTEATDAEPLLRAILESPRDIVMFALDQSYRYIAFNENHRETMARIWGTEIALGDSMLDHIGDAGDRQRATHNFDRALAGEHFSLTEHYGDLERRIYEDTYGPIHDDAGSVIGLTVFLTDVTRQARIEAQLKQHQEHLEQLVLARTRDLESAHTQQARSLASERLGLLTAGLAHDFNNLLVGILGCTDLALVDLPPDATIRPLIEQIERSAGRAASLTQQLLTYAGQLPSKIRPVNLNTEIQLNTALLRASLPSTATLKLELSEHLPQLQGDVVQLLSAIQDLVVNAGEALIDGHGTVSIQTDVLDVGHGGLPGLSSGDELSSGTYAIVRVTDDGCGLDPEAKARMFDPFFTTKFTGRGLGLASVLGIVRSHSGGMRVSSMPRAGAMFEILLPIAPEGPIEASSPPAHPRGSHGSVLVIDDEPQVRMVAVEMLRRLGFATLEATDGQQGIDLLERNREATVAAVLDMTMPRMDGQHAFERLRRLSPALPVVVISGWMREHQRLSFLATEERAAFLQKPFRLADLQAVLQEVGVLEET